MGENNKNISIELLKIIAALMVLTFHFWGSIVDVSELPIFQRMIITNFLWNGAAAVNVFTIISAWYLCDKQFKFKRIISVYSVTLFWCVLIGSLYLFLDKDITFFVRQVTPFSSRCLWYISAYLVVVLLSPILNKIIGLKKYSKLLFLCSLLFILVNTVYPPIYNQFPDWCRLAFLYVFTGLIKKYYTWVQDSVHVWGG